MPGTTSTALPSFSHDQHHETDVAKWKGGKDVHRITLNASCMTISGRRTEQLIIIAGFLPCYWLYE